jgi:hypothetical protein
MNTVRGKSNYMLLCCHRNAGQNHDISIANRSLELASQFKYFGTTVPAHLFYGAEHYQSGHQLER